MRSWQVQSRTRSVVWKSVIYLKSVLCTWLWSAHNRWTTHTTMIPTQTFTLSPRLAKGTGPLLPVTGPVQTYRRYSISICWIVEWINDLFLAQWLGCVVTARDHSSVNLSFLRIISFSLLIIWVTTRRELYLRVSHGMLEWGLQLLEHPDLAIGDKICLFLPLLV